MAGSEKLVLMVTHGPETPELATIPFVMACAALASEVEVVMGFQADGVLLVGEGAAEHVEAPAFPPLKKLLRDYIELGGKLLVCGPCVKSRELEGHLIAEAEVVAAARFVAEVTSATNCLTY